MDNKAKILDKIKKCLALGKSSNANEAATAMRQAQALMSKHGISQDDIDALGYGSETVEMPVQANQKLPVYISLFISLMKKAFGVRPITGRSVRISDASYTVSYWGPTGRVMTAAYAHTVCWRAMNKAWTEYLKTNPHARGLRGARSGFFVGWIEEVWAKVEAIGFTEEEEAKTEIAVQQSGLQLAANRISKVGVYDHTRNAGKESARDFHIHRPMDMEKKRLR